MRRSSCIWSQFRRRWSSFPILCMAVGLLCGYLVMRPPDGYCVTWWEDTCLLPAGNCSPKTAAPASKVTTTLQQVTQSTSPTVTTEPATPQTASKPNGAGYTNKLSTTTQSTSEKQKTSQKKEHKKRFIPVRANAVRECHRHDDRVSLRLIVLACNRAEALQLLLESLNRLETFGDSVALDIFIDRNKTNAVHVDTLMVADTFNFTLGAKRVHVWPHHVGIYGQWLDTWCPSANQSDEQALLLEEDLMVAPLAWKWLKTVRQTFGKRQDVAGYTLQSETVRNAVNRSIELNTNSNHTTFAYRLLGTWGYAPHPQRWAEFRHWYISMQLYNANITANNTHLNKTGFKPYVPGIAMTFWFQAFEQQNRQDSMWSIWHVYYANQEKIYTIYNNLNKFIGNGTNSLIVHNNAFGGLHYKSSKVDVFTLSRNTNKKLLNTWKQEYNIVYPKGMNKFEFNGNVSNF